VPECLALGIELLGVLERQVRERPLHREERRVEPARSHPARDRERQRIGRERAGRAAEHVARKLVERDDERERGERPFRPGVELSAGRVLVGLQEPVADERVEVGGLLEPALPVPPELGRVGRAEPERQHLRPTSYAHGSMTSLPVARRSAIATSASAVRARG
jgi:hypothetical protein